MNQEQRDSLFGKEPQFSEHKSGETIRFKDGSEEKTGRILHVIPPGQAVVGGEMHPMTYVVDTGHGFPSMVYVSDVLP